VYIHSPITVEPVFGSINRYALNGADVGVVVIRGVFVCVLVGVGLVIVPVGVWVSVTEGV
jgi:hypothetical protein